MPPYKLSQSMYIRKLLYTQYMQFPNVSIGPTRQRQKVYLILLHWTDWYKWTRLEIYTTRAFAVHFSIHGFFNQTYLDINNSWEQVEAIGWVGVFRQHFIIVSVGGYHCRCLCLIEDLISQCNNILPATVWLILLFSCPITRDLLTETCLVIWVLYHSSNQQPFLRLAMVSTI